MKVIFRKNRYCLPPTCTRLTADRVISCHLEKNWTNFNLNIQYFFSLIYLSWCQNVFIEREIDDMDRGHWNMYILRRTFRIPWIDKISIRESKPDMDCCGGQWKKKLAYLSRFLRGKKDSIRKPQKGWQADWCRKSILAWANCWGCLL